MPSGGTALLAQTLTTAGFYGGDGPVATRTLVTISGPSFTQAARIATLNPTGLTYSSAMTFSNNRALANGDIVLLHFWMRAIETMDESGNVTLEAYVEGPGPDYTKSTTARIDASAAWKEFFVPFAVNGAYAAGDLGFKFGFGATGRPQVLEIGGIEAWWYGTSRTLSEMPRTSFEYQGRALDAAWRSDAAVRINQYRKNNYDVQVVDSAGVPVAGKRLRIRQNRQAFQWGTAMVAARLMDTAAPANATYRQKILQLFNAGTLENDLKWPPWDGEWGSAYNESQTLNALAWARGNGLTMRGHVLVWPSVRNLPNSIGPLVTAGDPSVPQRIITHIDDVVPKTAGFLTDWDVLNEPYDNFDVMQKYGYSLMAEWFKEARRQDATAGLFVNDYGILTGGGLNVTKQDAYAATIQRLIDDGAPITGIGLQGHFSGTPTGMNKVWEILQRYATAFPTLDLRITEFDVSTDDEALQADYLRDFYTLLFSHPNVIGVQMWGFWAGAHWREAAAMYRTDWTEKPIGAAYRDLVLNTFMTDEWRTTGPDGRVTGRAFKGGYAIEDVSGQTLGALQIGDGSAGVGSGRITVGAGSAAAAKIVRQPLGTTVAPGATVRFAVEAAGAPAPTVSWYREGGALLGTGPTLTLAAVSAADAGRYYATAVNAGGPETSRLVRLGVRDSAVPATEKLANISTRGLVQTGVGEMVAGFVITGAQPKDVLIRAVGPRLADFGVPGVLPDPSLKLFLPGGTVPIASTDSWAPELAAEFTRLGAFDLGTDTASAALRLQLDPGPYSAVVAGVGGSTGVAIVEVYDAATGTPVEMVNISTRGFVGTGTDNLVAGFVIAGNLPQRVLIRGIGPTLTRFGVDGALPDAVLHLYERKPDGQSRWLRTNYDWTAAANVDDLLAATAKVGAFSLNPGDGDAVLLVDLEPGAYSVALEGANGETGIGLIEVYRVP